MIIIIIRMSSSDLRTSQKDFLWKYAIEVSEEKYIRCKFCNQIYMHRGVNRLHLVETHHGVKPCNKVSEYARLECKEALANYKDPK